MKSMSTALEGVDRLPAAVQSALDLSAQGVEEGATPIYMEGILSKGEFLEQMRFEKRRVDRSQAPLSMALFVLGEELLRDAKKLRGFLVNLKRGTRETDIKGWISFRALGLLLPDTDGPGAERCVELLNNGHRQPACTVVTGTYPDQLFQEVLEQTDDQAKIFTLDLEEGAGATKRSVGPETPAGPAGGLHRSGAFLSLDADHRPGRQVHFPRSDYFPADPVGQAGKPFFLL